MGDDGKISRLEADMRRLRAELAEAAERQQELADTRRAMLYLLEDVNAEAALAGNAKREWEATFDSISDLLFIHDAGMRVTRCNRAYKEAAGMKFKEIIGRPYYEVFPKMDGPFERCGRKECSTDAEPEELVAQVSGRAFKVRAYPIKGAAQGTVFVHVMEDITREKKAEEELRESETKYRHLFDNLKDAAFLVSASGGLIVETNKTGAALLGAPRAEIIGMHYSGLHPPDKAGDYDEMFAGRTGARREAGYESVVARRDGTVVPVAISGGTVAIGGREHVLAIFRDITEQKRSAEKMAQEMELNGYLLMIANATAHTTDIGRLMEKVTGCIMSIMRSEMSLSYLWNKERQAFLPSRAAGLSSAQAPLFRINALDLNSVFVARAVSEKRTVVENFTSWRSASVEKNVFVSRRGSPAESPGMPLAAPLHWIEGITTAVVFPLLGREGSLGLLLAIYAGEKGLPDFGSRDREVWDGISHQVSTALDEARLYKDSIDRTMELSRKIETIQTMHEIDAAILSAFQPDEIIETATRMVGKAVSCDRTTVALVDRQRDGFIYAAGFGTASLKKGAFVDFRETSATEVVKTGMPRYMADARDEEELLPVERKFYEEGFLSHVRVPLVVKGEVTGVLTIGSMRAAAFSSDDLSVLEKLASQIGVALENARLVMDVEELFMSTVKTLSEAIDAKSPWTRGHSERVTAISLEIGRALGMAPEELKDLELAGLLHDIGKLGTYEYILDKPGKLTDEELEQMRQHPLKGAAIIAPIKQMAKIVPVIEHHHENYDGTGYPEGLKGADIPFASRILTVADTVDAMGADRPYRKGKPFEAIVAELKRCSGTQFDPKMVEAFLKTASAGSERAASG